jgi:choline transport protein
MTDNQWISWVCGWFAVSGWIALVATAGSLAGSLITGAISLTHENYEVERWHIFLIYLAYMLGACFINIFGLRLLPTIDRAAIFWYVPTFWSKNVTDQIGR